MNFRNIIFPITKKKPFLNKISLKYVQQDLLIIRAQFLKENYFVEQDYSNVYDFFRDHHSITTITDVQDKSLRLVLSELKNVNLYWYDETFRHSLQNLVHTFETILFNYDVDHNATTDFMV